MVPITPALRAGLKQQLSDLDKWQERTGRRTSYLFTYISGRHEGEPIMDFVKSWRTACLEAALGDLEGTARAQRKVELLQKPQEWLKLRHDFRRTAVRNMLNTGTDERTAMQITGHKTRSVFDRYRIVNLADMQRAVSRLSTAKNRQLGQGSGGVA